MSQQATAFWNRHWRTLMVATLGALLAFGGSFLVPTSFQSSTRLLIRGRDATFLSSTGADLSTQPGVVDSAMSKSLAATYAGIATSRGIAERVVDRLGLDAPRESSGLISGLSGLAGTAYRCTKAIISYGYCASITPREAAVAAIQDGTKAEPLGANSGETAGTQGSYVLEITASGRSAIEARDVTDALADQLVGASSERFLTDAASNVTRLESRAEEMRSVVATKGKQLADYQSKHGISAGDGKQALSLATYEQMRKDLTAARAENADVEAQLESIEATIRKTPRNQRESHTTVQNDTTSSSQAAQQGTTTSAQSQTTTQIASANAVYSDLMIRKGALQAQLAGSRARALQLQSSLSNSKVVSKNATLAQASSLEAELQAAQRGLTDLIGTLERARTSAAQGAVDLTRLDTAGQPAYPSSPKRYVYLLLGFVLGGIAGAWLTLRRTSTTVGAHEATAQAGPPRRPE